MLSNGATVTVTIVARIDPSTAPGSIENAANVSSATPDPITTNNFATASTTVDASADLAITKSVTPNPMVAGRQATYIVTVTNNGPSDAQDAVVSDPLPTGTTFVGATPSQGGPCSELTGTVSCDLGTVAPGSPVTVRIDVNVADTASGPLVNTATVTSPTGPEPTPPRSRPTSGTKPT